MPLTKEALLAKVVRQERDEPSEVFGGELRLRELTRAEYRAASRAAYLGDDRMDTDRWYGGLFAAGVVDETGKPLFTLDELLAWPQRETLWDEVKRIADAILDLSEVGPEALKSDSAQADDG